jgi:hypothetical protein
MPVSRIRAGKERHHARKHLLGPATFVIVWTVSLTKTILKYALMWMNATQALVCMVPVAHQTLTPMSATALELVSKELIAMSILMNATQILAQMVDHVRRRTSTHTTVTVLELVLKERIAMLILMNATQILVHMVPAVPRMSTPTNVTALGLVSRELIAMLILMNVKITHVFLVHAVPQM